MNGVPRKDDSRDPAHQNVATADPYVPPAVYIISITARDDDGRGGEVTMTINHIQDNPINVAEIVRTADGQRLERGWEVTNPDALQQLNAHAQAILAIFHDEAGWVVFE